MTAVLDSIPDALRPEVDAALAWWNAREDVAFEVTGLVEPDAAATGGARELQLILCGGDRCEKRTFRVSGADAGFDVALLDDTDAEPDAPMPELDPPPGARRSWLDQQLAQHAFVVLVFYRGFW